VIFQAVPAMTAGRPAAADRYLSRLSKVGATLDALGPRFDLRRFRHAVLRNGAVPLTLLDGEISRWTAAQA